MTDEIESEEDNRQKSEDKGVRIKEHWRRKAKLIQGVPEGGEQTCGPSIAAAGQHWGVMVGPIY